VSRKILHGALLAGAGLALAATVRADAPAEQYLPFTRADKNIVDQKTTLEWERGDPNVAWSTYPTLANAGGAIVHCTSIGKRVPTLKELLTLVDENPTKEYESGKEIAKFIDTSAFPKTPTTGKFFTSTTDPNDPAKVYCVDFGTGEATICLAAQPAFVRCVK